VLVSTFATWGALYLLIVFWLVNAQSALRGAPLSKLLSNVVYSQLGWYIELVVSAAAVIVYVLFVADTYMSTTTLGVFVVQVGCQTLICCEYFFQLASSSNKLFHVLSSATPMHLLPLIPLIAAVQEGRCRIAGAFELEPGAWADDWPNRSLSFVYILILIRSRMVSRSLAMFLGRVILDGQQGGSTATHLYLGVVIWNLVVAVIFFAGWHLYISLMYARRARARGRETTWARNDEGAIGSRARACGKSAPAVVASSAARLTVSACRLTCASPLAPAPPSRATPPAWSASFLRSRSRVVPRATCRFEFNQQLNFVDAFYFTIVTIVRDGSRRRGRGSAAASRARCLSRAARARPLRARRPARLVPAARLPRGHAPTSPRPRSPRAPDGRLARALLGNCRLR
jgi:hypothetical protein